MFDDMNILITGGTGSFGKKLVEMVLKNHHPRRLVIFSRGELKQHEMRQIYPDTKGSSIRYFVGDVRDKDRLYRALNGVDLVVHAAALKQVSACEYNPFEAIQTNIEGAKNVIDAAIDRGVEKVMAISTDKAVNPVNLYGATKLCAEKLFIQANAYSGAGGTKFSLCRYGNVVGSRGSVIPLFRKQKECGIITITDPRMTRFFLTLDQGVNFVINCIEIMHGGEIFVPKISSANVLDLAKAIAPNCEVDYIGIRPGEKLHEVLISEDESRNTIELVDKYIILPAHSWWQSENWAGYNFMSEGSCYTSDKNAEKLGVNELKAWANSE